MKKNQGHASQGSRVIDHATEAIEQMAFYCAEHPGSPSAVRRPRLFLRGDLWIALLGPSVEEGIVGIGPTVSAALRAFDAQYLTGLGPAVEKMYQPDVLPRPSKAFAAARRNYRNAKSERPDRADLSGFAWPA